MPYEEAKTMNVFKKRMPNGKLTPNYYYRFMVDGKLFRGSTGHSNKRSAEAFTKDKITRLRSQSSAKALVENFRRELTGGRPITLAEVFGEFKKKPKEKPIGKQQLQAHESRWLDFVAFLKSKYPTTTKISDVTLKMAQDYIAHIRKFGRFEQTVTYTRGEKKGIGYTREVTKFSPRNCNAFHATLQQIFDSLMKDAGLAENPFRQIKKLKNKPIRRAAFTPDELKLIGEHADPFLRPIFVVGLYTGLRKGDICTLKWCEVDLKNGWIVRIMQKTGEEVRIPIMPALESFLRALPDDQEFVLPEQAAMYKSNREGISYRVRQFLTSKPLSFTTTSSTEERSRNVSTKDIHSLRHTFVWLAAKHGIALPVIQSIVGHLTAQMTQMYMDHATDEAKKEQIAHLPDYLGVSSKGDVIPPASAEERESELHSALDSIRELIQGKTELCNIDRQVLDIVIKATGTLSERSSSVLA